MRRAHTLQHDQVCAWCNEPLLPPPPGTKQVLPLFAGSGSLYLTDGEYPLHRCPSLTQEDELQLLRDAEYILRDPEYRREFHPDE
jgi:hypothetical protein